jgi:hypothetical protein
MSHSALKAKLEQIKQTLEESSAAYRDLTSDRINHTLILNSDTIYSETLGQLAILGIDLDKKELDFTALQKGADSLILNFYNAFKTIKAKKFTIEALKENNVVIVTVVQKGNDNPGNVFRLIRTKKQQAQRDYYTIIRDFVAAYNSTHGTEVEFDDRAFLDIGHYGTTSVAAQIATSTLKSIREELGEILAVTFNIEPIQGQLVVSVELQAASRNRGELSQSDKENLKKVRTQLDNILAQIDVINLEGSDSHYTKTIKTIFNSFAEDLGKVPSVKTNIKVKKIDKSKVKKVTSIEKVSTKDKKIEFKGKRVAAKRSAEVRETPESKINLRTLIPRFNALLPPTVKKNMVFPALRNRTGRFAQSTRIVDITQTPKGFPSIAYTYQKFPYQVFEPGRGRLPWADEDRDPRKLIEASIREIAVGIMDQRFYMRRV